jgi:cytochrome c553
MFEVTGMSLSRISLCVCLLGASPLAAAAGNPVEGKELAAGCGGCHGQDGNSSAPIFPKLAHQHAGYISKQLHDFKSQKRPEPTMSALAESLSDDEIEDLAAYYEKQDIHIEAGEKNPLGERIYRTGIVETGVPACSGCHGPGGNGNPKALFPQVNGQYSDYIMKTLKDFKAGARGNDLNGMMRTVASRLNEDQIKAVAEYIENLE